MLNYHEKKIKIAIDLLKTTVLLTVSMIIAFILIIIFEYMRFTLFFGK